MKPIYLLDTNVISEFCKPRPNQKLIKKVKEHESNCAICSTVWQESVFGYKRMPDGRKKDAVFASIQDVRKSYEIISYDDFAAQICGELQARCKEIGHPCPNFDSQIAATAIANGMILVTHNTSDFAALSSVSSLNVEDWWA